MSADMAEELKDYKVTVVSLWPGTVKTEKSYDWLRSGMLSQLTKMSQVSCFNGISYELSIEFLELSSSASVLVTESFLLLQYILMAAIYVSLFLVTVQLNVMSSCFKK